jgi:uncharacterized protein YkwD
MPNRSRLARFAALVAVALAASLPLAAPASAGTLTVSATDEDAFVSKINAERAKVGLAALKVCDQVRTVARNWSTTMAANNNFVHNPNYASQMPSGWTRAGENIAWGSGTYANASSLHTSLMNSSGHRANILGDFTHVGVGVVKEANSPVEMWVTQNFGKYPNGCGTTSSTPTTTKYTLTVGRSSYGRVSSSPTGIMCGTSATDCTEAYTKGTTVSLAAAPVSGRRFYRWSGACAGQANPCRITINQNTSVTVTFV